MFIGGPSEEHAQGDLGADDTPGVAPGHGEFDAGNQPQRGAEVILHGRRQADVAAGRAAFVDALDHTGAVACETTQPLAGLAAGGHFHHPHPTRIEAVLGAHRQPQHRATRDVSLEAVVGAVDAGAGNGGTRGSGAGAELGPPPQRAVVAQPHHLLHAQGSGGALHAVALRIERIAGDAVMAAGAEALRYCNRAVVSPARNPLLRALPDTERGALRLPWPRPRAGKP
ncbi:hypothetical protein G6F63_013555 [Rhizopus arrhizus]|nr:hypothetical protein G6F63_013555 [Rhizopus arrhizus]